jgi:hypothetical protein
MIRSHAHVVNDVNWCNSTAESCADVANPTVEDGHVEGTLWGPICCCQHCLRVSRASSLCVHMHVCAVGHLDFPASVIVAITHVLALPREDLMCPTLVQKCIVLATLTLPSALCSLSRNRDPAMLERDLSTLPTG